MQNGIWYTRKTKTKHCFSKYPLNTCDTPPKNPASDEFTSIDFDEESSLISLNDIHPSCGVDILHRFPSTSSTVTIVSNGKIHLSSFDSVHTAPAYRHMLFSIKLYEASSMFNLKLGFRT